MIEVSNSAINYGEVAVNDIPSYKMFRIKNLMDVPISVRLTTTSSNTKFQVQNENAFGNVTDLNDTGPYNALFDSVNLIDTLALEPKEERQLVTYFRAEKGTFGHLLPQSQPLAITGTIQLTSTSGGTASFMSHSVSQTDLQGASSAVSRESSSMVGTAGSPTTVRSETLSLPMYASVYRSQLQVTLVELQATMAPNKTQCIDFSVTNVSSRPLAFVIRSQSMTVKGLDLTLYEAERFEEPKLGHRILLDSNASISLSVMLRTTASSFSLQQYQSVLQCDNLRDPADTVLINVSVNIVSESQGDLVAVTDTAVNFGDAYRGTRAMAALGFLNVDVRENVVVSLSSSYKRKANGEVTLFKGDNATDEFSVPPQKGMVDVRIAYKPTFAAEQPDTEKIKFDLDFTATSQSSGRQQHIVIRCTASLFTSTITVSQKNLNFGDCQVGESKRRTFTIENQSPLPGNVLVQIRSKIISIEGASPRQNATGKREICEEFTIGPSSKLSISLKIAPQRVNPTYRKQLIIVNMANPNEDKQIINIEANNMAPPEAKMHDELYTWDCRLPGGISQSTPLCVISHVPALVPYSIKSKAAEPIVLNIKSTCPDIEVFYCADRAQSAQLDALITQWRSFCIYGRDADVGDLVHTPPERIEEVRKELLLLLSENGVVVRELTLESKATVTVYAVIIRLAGTNDALTKEDGLLVSLDGVETPRFVRFSYRLCATAFDLTGQKTKNFGEVNIGIKKTTTLPIVNKCKPILFIRVDKSRSVTAGHIRIEHSDKQHIYLVVRPFATKEIELSFLPGIKGNFDEKVTLTNIMDPRNKYTLTLKATVIKADTFDVSPDSWNFGSVMLPPQEEVAQVVRIGAKFMVANTSKTKRQIRVKLDLSSFAPPVNNAPGSPALLSSSDPIVLLREMGSALFGFVGVDVRIQLDMELSGATGSSRKIEEQIEKLEQKLKIHERKKKQEKIAIVKTRIEALRRALLGEEVDLNATAGSADHDYSESEDESTPQKSKSSQASELMVQLLRDGVPLPTMSAGESVSITFVLTFSRLLNQPVPAGQTTTLNLLLYEAKDQEVNRIFPIDVTLIRPEDESDVHTAAMPSGGGGGSALGPGTAAPSSYISLHSGDPGRAVSCFMGHPLMVLRNTIVNDHAELTILVQATSNTAVVVLEPRRCGGSVSATLDAHFKFFPRNGVVRGDEALRIVADCTPRSVGPQKYFVPVKNLQNAADVRYFVIELNPTEEEERVIAEPKLMTFHDVATPCNPASLEAQLLLLRSRFKFPHSLLVRSSKPSQVLLFEDAQCTMPLANPIQRTFMRETIRVYVRFVPSPKATKWTARQIRAGIVVEAIVASGEGRYSTVGKTVVEVTTRVGSGVLQVPVTSMELGAVPMAEQWTMVSIEVTNPSDSFQIRTRVVAATPNVVLPPGELHLRPLETRLFPVQLVMPLPGLFSGQVAIHNLTCQQEPILVALSLLRRDDAVTALTEPSEGSRYALPIAAVARGDDGGFRLHNSSSATLVIRNASSRDLVLASQCAAPLMLSAKDGGGGDNTNNDDDDERDTFLRPRGSPTAAGGLGGGLARAEARRDQPMLWTLMGAPALTDEQSQRLQRHELISVEATAQVRIDHVAEQGAIHYNLFHVKRQLPVEGQCVLLLPFSIPLAVSEGRAEPTLVDLGTVGLAGEDHENDDVKGDDDQARLGEHGSAADGAGEGGGGNATHSAQHQHHNINGHQPSGHGQQHHPSRNRSVERKRQSRMRVRLINQSRHLPLRLKVECPPIIRFSTTRLTIPPGQTAEVEANLQLKEIPTQGAFRYEAFFVNELNPDNDIAVVITGQYYWKVFRLRTKTTESVHDSLALPPLHVEGTVAVPAVLSEERLTISATEPNVELRLSVQGNPRLEGLVQLQVLRYDATSAVDALTFLDAAEDDDDSNVNDNGETGDGTTTTTTTAAAAATMGGGGTTAAGEGSGGGANKDGAALATGGDAGAGGGTSGGADANAATATTTSSADGQQQQQQRRKPAAQPQQQRSHTVRVRCVLLKSDLAALATLFTGFRKKSGAAETLTFDKIPEIEKRRSTAAYANLWLGTVTFSNRLTDAEDLTVFGQLDPFSTFSCPSKLTLAPSRMPAATSLAQDYLVYAGEVRVTNICDAYPAELGLTALISEQLATPVTVHVTSCEETLNEEDGDGANSTNNDCGGGGAAAVDAGGSNAGSGADDANANSANISSTARRNNTAASDAIISTTFTNGPGGTATATRSSTGPAGSNSPPPPADQPKSGGTHRFRVGPRAVATLRVLITSNSPRDMKSIHQSSLEQLVAIAIVDEAVASSASVVRLSVTPLQGELDEAPLYHHHHRETSIVAAAEERRAGGSGRSPLDSTVPAASSGCKAAAAAAGGSGGGGDGGTSAAAAGGAESGPGSTHGGGKALHNASAESLEGLAAVTATSTASSLVAGGGGPSAPAAAAPTAGGGGGGVDVAMSTSVGSGGTAASDKASKQQQSLYPGISARQTISLRGCTAVADCPGAYAVGYSVPRGESPQGEISIRNNLPDRPVTFTASVTSQTPLSWLFLLSSSGVLEPGETQPLRLNLSTGEVGSFVAYVAVTNNANPFDVVYLRLSAEVYVPSSGEGLFEVVTSGGFRVSSNEVREVSLGRLYGARTSRAYIALEIVNRSSVPLEFPVSVVKPFRMGVKSVHDASPRDALLLHHNRRQQQHQQQSGGSCRHSSSGGRLPCPDLANDSPIVNDYPTNHNSIDDLTSSFAAAPSTALDEPAATTAVARPLSRPPQMPQPSLYPGGGPAPASPVFEGKLIACHIHGVPTQSSQKYFVVDPKSRIRLAFVLSCNELRVPPGYAVFGETDVVVKCKQARDANFTFRVRFEAHQPTFFVDRQVEVGQGEEYATVTVRNALPQPQTFIFRSQSPVLYVAPGTGTPAGDEVALLAAAAEVNRASLPPSFAEIEVRGNATGTFAVRVDVMRAAVLLHYDKGVGDAKPAICEHAFILNGGNPRERVRMQFRQGLKGSSSGSGTAASFAADNQSPQASELVVPSNSPAPIIGSGMVATAIAKPVKAGGQHIGEHFILRFTQELTSTLTYYEKRLLGSFAYYGGKRDGDADAGSEDDDDDVNNGEYDDNGNDGDGQGNDGGSGSTSGSSNCGDGGGDDTSAANTDRASTVAVTNNSSSVVSESPHYHHLRSVSRSGSRLLPPLTDAGDEGRPAVAAVVPPSPAKSAASPPLLSPSPHHHYQHQHQHRPSPPDTAAQSSSTAVAVREERRRQHGLPAACWRSLRALLVDLTWLVDELVFYNILLRNSRLIQGYCVFVSAAVCNHPVVKSWRLHRAVLPPEFNIFAEYFHILEFLPCQIST